VTDIPPVFDDGSQVEIEVEPDDPPSSGEWVDSHTAIETALNDPDELAASEFLGEAIDPDDDEDNGSQWGTVQDPAMTAADFDELAP
jgi:hypothetical protein